MCRQQIARYDEPCSLLFDPFSPTPFRVDQVYMLCSPFFVQLLLCRYVQLL